MFQPAFQVANGLFLPLARLVGIYVAVIPTGPQNTLSPRHVSVHRVGMRLDRFFLFFLMFVP